MSIMKGDKAKVKDIMKENKEILQEDTTNLLLFGYLVKNLTTELWSS